jgi:hypothetical protein
VFAFDHVILLFARHVLIGTALFLLTTTVAGATDTVSTPGASEYTRETTPVAERQPETSTAADLRLAILGRGRAPGDSGPAAPGVGVPHGLAAEP